MHNTNQTFIPSYFHKGQTKAIIIGLIYYDSIEWLYFVRILNVDLMIIIIIIKITKRVQRREQLKSNC